MADETSGIVEQGSFGSSRRVLALDVRPRKMGFVVFEESRLLDWGVRTYGSGNGDRGMKARAKLNPLLDLHAPGLLVLRKRKVNPEAEKALVPITQALREEAVLRSIGMRFVTTDTVKRFFGTYGCENKHQIAVLLAKWYPELAWRLPRKRKPWEPEPHSMALFDAAAGGASLLCDPNS